MVADSSVSVSTISCPAFGGDVLNAPSRVGLRKADRARHGGVAAPKDRRTPGLIARSHRGNGEDDEESIATLGLDFLPPYKSASHSWRIDAKA
jgi:hypothetical protein